MKTFLAALVAGLIGGGAAVGVVALDLLPRQAKPLAAAQPETASLEQNESAAPTNRDEEVEALKRQVEALEVRLAKPAATDNTAEIEALRAEIAQLKNARPAAAVAGDSVDVPPTPAVTPEFDTAVRDVMNRVAEERAAERRLNAHAERLSELEAQKLQIAEYIPNLVKNQAANLGIPEASIAEVSNVLVLHAQTRAEIQSEIRGQRIDDAEVDDEAYKLKFEELNQSTITALSSQVDQATAEKILGSLERAARNNRDNNQGRRGQR